METVGHEPIGKRKQSGIVRTIASVVLMTAIFGWMGHKIFLHWSDVRARASEISVVHFTVAACLFAFFLFAFRALVWRRILARFGYPIPTAAAVRIWSVSELARYLPGVIWQVAGRVYLVKPYGVSGTVCAASQILELVIYLLANILLGVGCLIFFGIRNVHGSARLWMFVLAAMVPLLAMLVHPRIFYHLMNRVMRRLKKPELTGRLSGKELTGLLSWNILGLLIQNLAVFLIVKDMLHMQWAKYYVVTGAYSLAWCAGFLAVLNPGGLGVREVVLVAALHYALPQSVQTQFASKQTMDGSLTFLVALLRLWTVAGELILTAVAHAADRIRHRAPEAVTVVGQVV